VYPLPKQRKKLPSKKNRYANVNDKSSAKVANTLYKTSVQEDYLEDAKSTAEEQDSGPAKESSSKNVGSQETEECYVRRLPKPGNFLF